MTLADLWEKIIYVDLTPLFEAIVFAAGLVIFLAIVLGGVVWWVYRHDEGKS